jgi:3-hydroxyacyl-CoA dehydrogenase
MMPSNQTVAIVGVGLIGRSWAICFARAGFRVMLFDHVSGAVSIAMKEIQRSLIPLQARSLLNDKQPEDIMSHLVECHSLAVALEDAAYIQENTPEKIEIKIGIFEELDRCAPSGSVIASSTSALLPSQFTNTIPGADRCLVAHPLNPPHLIPTVEIIPHIGTRKSAIEKTRSMMLAIGQKPILAQREIEGFIMNRLQGAVLDEAFTLIFEDIATISDIDTAMRDGLARRWSFMGPFETIDLNAPDGVAGFINRYGKTYAEIGRSRPNRVPWENELADRVIHERREQLPADRLSERQTWRDEQLSNLAEYFKNKQ